MQYHKDNEFRKEALLQVKPTHIRNLMALKAYRKIDYEVEVDRTSGARASHLEQMKKGISCFMPDNSPMV